MLAVDTDRDTLSYGTSSPTNGTVVMDSRGHFTYTPTAPARHAAAASNAPAAAKTDTFTVTVDDNQGGVATAVVTVRISPANARPTGLSSTIANTNLNSGVVSGTVSATDPDGDTFSYTATAPRQGRVDRQQRWQLRCTCPHRGRPHGHQFSLREQV